MKTCARKPLTDEQLLWYDPFADDKGDIELTFSNVVRTRRPQQCTMNWEAHAIPIGARAVVYRWQMGDEWGRMYCCADCIEKWRWR